MTTTGPSAPIGVQALTATLGAEVTGVDLADVDAATLEALKKFQAALGEEVVA